MDNVSIIKKYFSQIKVNKKFFALTILFGAIGQIAKAISPIFFGKMIDNISNVDNQTYYFLFLFVFFIVVYRLLFVFNNYYAVKQYKEIFNSIHKIIVSEISGKNKVQKDIAKAVNIVNDSVDEISDFTDQLSDIIINTISITIILIILFGYNFSVGLVVLLINIFFFWFYEKANLKTEKLDLSIRKKKDNLIELIYDIFNFKNDKNNCKKYKKEANSLALIECKKTYNWVFKNHIIPMILVIIQGLFIVLLLFLYSKKQLTIGEIIAILSYYSMINEKIVDINSDLLARVKFVNVSLDRIKSM